MYREFDLISRIAQLFPKAPGVRLGIGDDCAVLEPGYYDLVTTDTLVENVHFRRDWSSPKDIGWKTLAVSLSDVAAMGGVPGCIFLNLSLSAQDCGDFVDGALQGLLSAAKQLVPDGVTVSIAGGDTTAIDGPVVLTVTLLGTTSKRGAIERRGARPGDRIFLSGYTGCSGAAVDLLASRFDVLASRYPELLLAHRRPQPKVALGMLLGELGLATAMLDVSDGLAQDLGHIVRQSCVGARVELSKLPIHPQLLALHHDTGVDMLSYMTSGGDDYELLFTVAPEKVEQLHDAVRAKGWIINEIGEVVAHGEGLDFVNEDGKPVELTKIGYQHF